MLEAMAAGIPVVATAWGGALDYIDENCGILVKPSGKQEIINGFAEGMKRLASDPALRSRLGRAGKERIETQYDWERKIDYITNIYLEVFARHCWSFVEGGDAMAESESAMRPAHYTS
jgi:glycosyltransferase involved in cell wall biosynthesis